MSTPAADDAAHILVVDDDSRIRTLIARFLGESGYRVSAASSAQEARTRMGAFAFDLIVLDVMMPGESGFDLAGALRDEGRRLPILMLTARGEGADRIRGLELGADDYLTKPFEPRELELRVRNLLRRAESDGGTAQENIAFGDFLFDLSSEELTRTGQPVRLTERERRLLSLFAHAPDGIVSRLALVGAEGNGGERAIDVQINRLRRKIEVDSANPRYLQTVRGVGYRLRYE